MAVDVALHKADRENLKVIPAESICRTSFGHANGFRKRPITSDIVQGEGRNLISERVWQSSSIEHPLGRSPLGAGRTASRGLGAGGKQSFV